MQQSSSSGPNGEDDLPASSSGSLAPSDVDSIPTASTPRAAEDAEVGSQEGTRQEEEAPEVPQGNLPDFAPDSAPEPVVAPESGGAAPCQGGRAVRADNFHYARGVG